MKKRIPIFLLAVLLAVTISPAAAADPGSRPLFSDLPDDHWAHQYVAPLYEQGVVNGYPDGTFKPNRTVTWGESFKLILLAIGEDEPERLPDTHWAYPYIEPAIANRLMYSFDESYLDEVPTRLDVARMTARALDLTDISGESPYNDCDDGYVVELYEKGIMDGFLNGDGSRSFRPDKSITRAEISTIIWRITNIDVSEGMFRCSNYWVDLLDSVPLTTFSRDQFGKDELDRVTYSGGYYARGIDVSGHKGDIDWQAVAADGIEFAIIRAGNRGWGASGTLMEDSKFEQNMQGAIEAGLPVGAYYFSNAITVEEAEEEVELFLARLEPYREYITYPVVCDWEYLGGNESRAYGVDARIITQCIDTFCRRVAEAGYTPMVYFNEYCGLIKMDLSKLTQYEFWFAEYTNAPSCVYNFQMWQYSSKGKVAGINSDVDMNLCFVPYPKDASDAPKLTLEQVRKLAQKGMDLSWSDFERYKHEDIGSGLYIWAFDVDGKFDLLIGGGWLQSQPMYIRLCSKADSNICIDIRTESIDDFVARFYP